MSSSETPQTLTLTLTYQSGSMFAAPDNTVLIHACNTQGSWGSGIALAFKQKYPSAFKIYNTHCLSKSDPIKTGTCLLIQPCEKTGARHWIACLFTSAKYGFRKDGPEQILKNTKLAVEDLLVKVMDAETRGGSVGELRMCKINSGRFGVEWKRTETVLEELVVENEQRSLIEIWDREGNFS